MDKLTKGTWIVNTVKHLAELKQYTTELAFYEATEQAGKAGAFLGRLVADKQEIIPIQNAKVFARQSSISPAELNTYLSYLRQAEKVDYSVDAMNRPKEIEIYCFSGKEALESVSTIYETLEPQQEENASLIGLNHTFHLPRTTDELKQYLTTSNISEECAETTIKLQQSFGLVRESGQSGEKVLFNEYSFNGDPQRVVKALSSLDNNERDMVIEIQNLISETQGFLIEHIPSHIPTYIVEMMEGVGLVDGITVQSAIGSATFLTTPQIKGQGIGNFSLSEDVFHKAKILLSCLRFGQTKSTWGRGKISTLDKMMNILNKLLRGQWVGPATAIGQDYALLEIDGVIQTRPAKPYGFEMKLRQLEVGELVRQMITYNKVALEAEANIGDLLKDQPSGCIIPETRKSEIFAKSTAPVEALRNKLLTTIRTSSGV
ncbi:hypothetical protein KSP24_00945 [Paenibacillus sp. AK121]|uniref:hypothetical protein n=1 Tax=Paenibacillus sp. AK121 TaxID=2849670 RepID=UPI001C232261|nr:hypothetical protein [Paenibacillus sp. AK121]MBU9705490.1 hypothetical protein [Paenibacillus sp. AK121]